MKKLILVIGILSCFSATADFDKASVWQDLNQSDPISDDLSVNSNKHRYLLLDETSLKDSLSFSSETDLLKGLTAAKTLLPEISLPLPDGTFILMTATPSKIISTEMSESYPELKTWNVVGVDDTNITGVIDFTNNGFSGMLMMPDGDTVFIDPDKDIAGDSYKSFSKRENDSDFNTALNCEIHETHENFSVVDSDALFQTSARALDDSSFPNVSFADTTTYRLALSATAEYTENQGGTAGARSSMVTSVNRINTVFERDAGVTFELIDAPELIFSDETSDPFSDPNDPSALMIENGEYLSDQGRLDDFDLGHVLSFRPRGGGSGVAFLEVACVGDVRTSNLGSLKGLKALGATTSSNPRGSTFDLGLLAHEIGHQLGANHSFSGIQGACSANRSDDAAVEPGSGSSIMSYSGTCGSDNLPENVPDQYFHFASIAQISQYTRFGDGARCGTNETTSSAPTANAGTDLEIPANTPFFLDGVASGGTSSWDQIDTGTASAVDIDRGDNAIIRHNIPSSDEDRYIPSLSDLFAGRNTIGEILPTTSRELNFAYVVRDGGVSSDKKLINVTDTNSIFSVSSQLQDTTLITNQNIDVSWNIADTNQAPISCDSVDIQLINVDGAKNMLLSDTPNDGSQSFILPDSVPEISDARVFIACSDNSFFNISSGNITVEKGEGIEDTISPVITLNGQSSISLIEGINYIDEGATATDDVDGDVVVTTTGTVDTDTVGSYVLSYTATDAAGNSSSIARTINVVLAPQVEDITAPLIMLNGENVVTVVAGSDYIDEGAVATDNLEGDIELITTEDVDTDKIGSYTVRYSATDLAGNNTSIERVVNVVADSEIDSPFDQVGKGGSFGYFLFPFMILLGLRRYYLKRVK